MGARPNNTNIEGEEEMLNKGHENINMEMNLEHQTWSSSRTSRDYNSSPTSSKNRKWITVLLLLFLTLFGFSEAASPSCFPIGIRNGKVHVQGSPRNGKYANETSAIISCEQGYHLKSFGDTIYCVNGKWIASDRNKVKEDQLCERIGEERCGPPPELTHGYFRPSQQFYSSSESVYAVGMELQAICDNSFSLNCLHQQSCGRIVCTNTGDWIPKDGSQIHCVAVPMTVVSGNARDARADDSHGHRNTSSMQNYLILALALVCIFGVAALTIALLRRPIFCKKRSDSYQNDPHNVMCTSSSPAHGFGGGESLDAIPVAMNTGIFVPGVEYNLQDYTLQDGPLCGTAAFK